MIAHKSVNIAFVALYLILLCFTIKYIFPSLIQNYTYSDDKKTMGFTQKFFLV